MIGGIYNLSDGGKSVRHWQSSRYIHRSHQWKWWRVQLVPPSRPVLRGLICGSLGSLCQPYRCRHTTTHGSVDTVLKQKTLLNEYNSCAKTCRSALDSPPEVDAGSPPCSKNSNRTRPRLHSVPFRTSRIDPITDKSYPMLRSRSNRRTISVPSRVTVVKRSTRGEAVSVSSKVYFHKKASSESNQTRLVLSRLHPSR